MKKKKLFAFAIILMFVALIALLIYLPMHINDVALSRFEQKVWSEFDFSEEVAFIESISACCNSSGTGNHTDLYVAVLVKSAAGEETINSIFSEIVLEDTHVSVIDVAEKESTTTLAMDIADITFSKSIESTEGYYIVEFIKSAPLSNIDFRGF